MSRTLDEIYASLPKIQCKGLCSECCGPIDFTKEERARMEAAFGRPIGKVNQNLQCPALACDQCMVYDVRPLICRIWGLTPKMACPHGCKPDRPFTDDEAFALLAETGMISVADCETTSPIPLDERAALWKRLGPIGGRIAYEKRLMEFQKTGK